MWKFLSASSGAPCGGNKLFSPNNFQGRQTWEFDEGAGSAEERAKVEELRAAFTANRHKQKHRCALVCACAALLASVSCCWGA